MSRTTVLGVVGGTLGAALLFLASLAPTPASTPLGLPLVGVAQAHGGHEEWVQVGDEFDWSGVLEPGDQLEVEVVNGSIRAQAGSGTAATAHGTRRVRDGSKSWKDVEIRVQKTRDGAKIWVRHEDQQESRDNWVRVDFRVEVPAGVTFVPSTVNGSILAENLRGPVNASSVNGAIHVGGNGRISASAVNGAIHASLAGRNDAAPVDLETVNGSIELLVPKDANADVSASAVHGDITSDLPIVVHKQHGSKSLNGKIGRGGPQFRLSTVNGSIRLVTSGA